MVKLAKDLRPGDLIHGLHFSEHVLFLVIANNPCVGARRIVPADRGHPIRVAHASSVTVLGDEGIETLFYTHDTCFEVL